ncbi:telomerase-binding protein EST1A [Acipenser ruthenus]|uniref:telomerase-binding protein EST1A n=1 Tax=Acipenser ruthenus TaxID=7906 RepID=UPI0027427D45|nr:telomerase-binding protein EST1A [Acipenser ruthenus]
MEMKMAEELERVRISAAELRGAAPGTSRDQSLRAGEPPDSGKDQCDGQQRRDGKRPDLRLYQPGMSRLRPRRETSGSSEGDGRPEHCPREEEEEEEERGTGPEAAHAAETTGTARTPEIPARDSSASVAAAAPAGSPKQARKTRKPDRQIYQPGGRRLQQPARPSKETGVSKDLTVSKETSKETGVSKDLTVSKETSKETGVSKDLTVSKETSKETGVSKDLTVSKETSKETGVSKDLTVSKETSKETGVSKDLTVSKETSKETGVSKDLTLSKETGVSKDLTLSKETGVSKEPAADKETTDNKNPGVSKAGGAAKDSTETLIRKTEGMNISEGVSRPAFGEEGEGGRKKAGSEGRRNKAGGEGAQGRKEKGARRTRGGGGGGGRGSGERERAREREGDESRKKSGLERERGKVVEREGEACEGGSKAQQGGGVSSKRYSKSDKRRNRTYSTSSASSGTSFDGPGNGGGSARVGESRRKQHQQQGARDRGGRVSGTSRSAVTAGGGDRRERARAPKKQASISSTDSYDDFEQEDREEREGEGWSPDRSSNNRRRGGGSSSSSDRRAGGILRVSFDRESNSLVTTANSAEQKRRDEPRGRGRGILILPAHTDLTAPPESGSRLLVGSRGARGQGRGGATRRLWDPNNPEQKPALLKGQQQQQQQQHLGLQQHLHLQQAVYSQPQLHFLDTDDETTGSPPAHQEEAFQGYRAAAQQAVASCYYKFQNSDNPYYYQPTTAPRYPYPYQLPYQIQGTNGVCPPAAPGYYAGYPGVGAAPSSLQQHGYISSPLTPEEAELQAKGMQQQELIKLLRIADKQELQLSNLLSRDRLSPEGLDRMAQLRAELLSVYERVILSDLEYSDTHNLDQALWKNAFYQVIEKFRQMLKDPASETGHQIRAMLLTLLDEGAAFFDSLLMKLQAVFQFKLEDYMDGMAIRSRPLRKTVKYALISAQRCMICQGDIARYREQANDTANYGKARSWYLKAQQIAPKNGRPYNQLALLAIYTKRKLDAVYYYMRSLAASNPILTAKESLMSLFEETKRKADQMERRRQQQQQREREEVSECSAGPRGRGGAGGGGRSTLGDDAARVEIWVRPARKGQSRAGSESGKESEQDSELSHLIPSDLNKRFILSFLHAHGKLFTKIGMETFPVVAARVLQEFRALLQHSPSLIGNTRMLQLITINMFAVHNAQSRDGGSEARSVIQDQATSLGLSVFALLVERCTELLKDTPRAPPSASEDDDGDEEEDVKVSSFHADLRELLPSVKVWSDWMLGQPDQWNPPPCSLLFPNGCCLDVWQTLAQFCNTLAGVNQGAVPLYKDPDEDLRLLVLEEDRLLSGFIPLLGAPQEPCYVETASDKAIAADCKRVTVLKYFLEALCGQEEPLLAFKGGKYVSMATVPDTMGKETGSQEGKQADNQDEDVLVEAMEEDSESDASGSEDDFRELRARKHALTVKVAEQQRRRDKIQAVLQPCRQLEIEITPVFLVPDTNGFIDHLNGLAKLLSCKAYILVVPLIVITELDGLARGQETEYRTGSHARQVQEHARSAISFLERGFENREPCLRALTSRGNELESISFRSEDPTGQQGNNDDLILSCCLHYCKDKAKDFMPTQKDEPIRLRREVVLLTDDRNLRVKALTRNVPVRDIPAFLKWAKVG